MSKRFFMVITAIAVAFITAVGMCAQALNTRSVGSFSTELRVVIDAGHGGIDGGVSGVSTKVKERDINLAVSFLLEEELTAMGFAVTLTRTTDEGLYDTTAKGFKKRDMQRRKEIIEEAMPQMVISIHQNFYPSHSARGGQVFYDEKMEGSKRLAEGIQSGLNELYATQKVKGRVCKNGDYFMLHCYPCPSVIVECGFLSNPQDEGLLCVSSWQKKLAQSIARGVFDYFAKESA